MITQTFDNFQALVEIGDTAVTTQSVPRTTGAQVFGGGSFHFAQAFMALRDQLRICGISRNIRKAGEYACMRISPVDHEVRPLLRRPRPAWSTSVRAVNCARN